MNNSIKNLLFLTGGLAIGAITGILTAPKSGKETREDIMGEINNLKAKLNDLTGKSRKSLEDKIEELKDSLSEMEAQMKN